MSEADKVNNKVVSIAVVVTIGALLAMVIGVYELFGFTITEEINRKVNSVENTQLRNLRVEDGAKLSRYQWVDQKAGVVRVPADRAVELILSEGYKRPAPVEAPAAPAPGGAVAPAPGGAAPAAPAPGGAAPAAPAKDAPAAPAKDAPAKAKDAPAPAAAH